MTIDRRWAVAIPAVLLGWIGVLALVMRLSGAAPAALAILPPEGLLASLPEGVSVLAISRFGVTVKSNDGAEKSGLVAALYAAGALLVLPAGLAGCLPGPARQSAPGLTAG